MIDAESPGGRRAGEFLALARSIGALLHETQRERGVSAIHVQSGRRLFAGELHAQSARSEARRRAVVSLIEDLGPSLLPGDSGRLERIAGSLGEVSDVRREVASGSGSATKVVDAFSTFNAEVLAAMDVPVASLLDGESHCLALAAIALLHAKEKVGIERARVGMALVGDGPDERDRVALAELLAEQATYLHMYACAAPSTANQMLRRALASRPSLEVRRIEDRLLSTGPRVNVDVSAWFKTISEKIELLDSVAGVTLDYFPAA